MSAAINARDARTRARIAIQKIRRGQIHSRTFDDCFEMGDGDTVFALVKARADRDPIFAALARKALVGI